MVVMFAFHDRWYYFRSVYYIKFFCFFTVSYYARFTSLSIPRAVWYKIKDCSLTHVLLFPLFFVVYSSEGQILSFYVYLHLRLGTKKHKNINFLLIWIPIFLLMRIISILLKVQIFTTFCHVMSRLAVITANFLLHVHDFSALSLFTTEIGQVTVSAILINFSFLFLFFVFVFVFVFVFYCCYGYCCCYCC